MNSSTHAGTKPSGSLLPLTHDCQTLCMPVYIAVFDFDNVCLSRKMNVLLLLLLASQVCALFEQAINAEGLDVDLDQVAAAAMAAVESAVKDEVEAATVVSATQSALATTLKDLQAISGNNEEEAAVVEIAAALASTEAAAVAALASTDKSGSPTPAADAIQLLDSLTSSAAGAAGAGLLQAVDAASSNGAPGSSAAPSSATSSAPSPTPTAAPPAYASMDGGKAKQSAAKAKLLQAAGFAVAAALAFAFIKSPAGEVGAIGSWGSLGKCRCRLSTSAGRC
jgi:hypothetical protein